MSIPLVRVLIQLDKPRTLILDFNALCRVEEVTGVSMLIGEPAFSSMRMMRALVWAGLLHEDPSLTVEHVGKLLGEADASDVLEKIVTAYAVSMPDAEVNEEGESEDLDPTNSPHGETSGQSAGTISD
jgi:hypothetical protein